MHTCRLPGPLSHFYTLAASISNLFSTWLWENADSVPWASRHGVWGLYGKGVGAKSMLAQHLGVCAHCQHMSLPADLALGSCGVVGMSWMKACQGHMLQSIPGECSMVSCLEVPWAEMKVPPSVTCGEDLVPFQGGYATCWPQLHV